MCSPVLLCAIAATSLCPRPEESSDVTCVSSEELSLNELTTSALGGRLGDLQPLFLWRGVWGIFVLYILVYKID